MPRQLYIVLVSTPPGLIYVAVSRVKSPDTLQILNFSPRQLLRPHQRAVDMCTTHHICEPLADLSCCCKRSFEDNNLISVKDRFDACEEDDEPFTFPSDLFDGPVRQCFEDEEVAAPLELLDVYDRMMRHQSSLASPPEGFLIKSRDHLLALKASPTSIASPFWKKNTEQSTFC